MGFNYSDATVFAKDYPEARLILEIKPAVSSPPDQDKGVQQLARNMWGANCHFGLVMTSALTYVLRDDFTTYGPGAIRVTDIVPTTALLGRLEGWSEAAPTSDGQLAWMARAWLQRLAASYDTALPEDPELIRVFFPDIVSAVAGGRVVSEVAA